MSTGINIGKSIKILDEGSQITPDVSQIDFTGSGITATAVGNNVTVNVVGASGVWGISNASGVYTYYTTLTLAMAAATAGQTIELFADVTETGAVSITLKNGVNINGNGHTYTLSVADTTPAFITANSISNYEFNFLNTIIKRTNSTGTAGACFLVGINTEGRINFEGSVLINTGSGLGIGAVSSNGNVQIYNATIFTNSGNGMQINSNSINTKVVNCTVYSTSGTAILVQAFCDVVGCIGESNSGTGINMVMYTCYNSIGRSNSGVGLSTSGGSFINCTGFSSSNYGGLGVNAGYFYNSILSSSGNIGLYLYNADAFAVKNCQVSSGSNVALYYSGAIASQKIDIHNTVATSNANFAFSTGNGSMTLYNCSGETLATSCVSAKNSIYGGVYRSKWNNAAGHAITISAVSQFDIVNTTAIVTNASANAIYSASATTLNYANNSFKGSTTAVNANITQGIVNTQDNQGNILI